MSSLSKPVLIAALDRKLVPPVRTIARVLHDAGHRSWVVGGCVRDVALSLIDGESTSRIGDWDLATSAQPREVQRLFRRVIPTGIKHGTVTIVIEGEHFEVTTLRGERGHTDGRHPDEVFFVDDIDADLARRDFTVNAVAYDIEGKTLHDPFDGLEDLKARQLRAVGQASARFAEDGLRVLRCARFSATLDFDIEDATRRAIAPSLGSFEKVAQERVQQEWFKALSSAFPSRFLRVVVDEGLLSITAPELFSSEESYLSVEQTAQRLDRMARVPLGRLALLVIGGSARRATTSERLDQSATNATTLGKRLRLSRAQLADLVRLCRHHLLPDELVADPSPPHLRRYIAQIGRTHLQDVIDIMGASLLDDESGLTRTRLGQLSEALKAQAQSSAPLSLGELDVTGADLIASGIDKGPLLGKLLAALLDRALDDPSINDRQRLIDEAHRLRATSPMI